MEEIFFQTPTLSLPKPWTVWISIPIPLRLTRSKTTCKVWHAQLIEQRQGLVFLAIKALGGHFGRRFIRYMEIASAMALSIAEVIRQ